MKKIVLFTAVLAFVASSSFAVSLFVNNGSDCESTVKTEMLVDQGEKTKSKDSKKETAATTEKKSTSSSSKSSCKKSCAKSCDKKGSKSKK